MWKAGDDIVHNWRGRTVEGDPTQLKSPIRAHDRAVLAVRFNQRGDRFLTCGDGRIKVWSFETRECRDTFKNGSSNFKDVDLLNDECFASCDDGQIFLWDLSTRKVISKIQCGAGEQLNAIRCDKDGVVFAGVDCSLALWDHRSNDGALTKIHRPFESDIKSLSIKDTNLVAGCGDGTVCKLDLSSKTGFTLSLGQPLICISLSHDGNCALASCLDSKLRILNVHPTRYTEKIVQVYEGHVCKSLKTDCCFINRDKLDPCVVAGSKDGMVCIWNALSGERLSEFKAHSARVTSIALHPEDKGMITASETGNVRFWKLLRW